MRGLSAAAAKRGKPASKWRRFIFLSSLDA
jgi:hypothetical protein